MLNFLLNCGPARGHNFTRNLVNLSTPNVGDKIVSIMHYVDHYHFYMGHTATKPDKVNIGVIKYFRDQNLVM